MSLRIFSLVLNMSITGTVVIVFLLPLRRLLRKLPAVYACILWAAPLFRLLCPVSIGSGLSILKILHIPVHEYGWASYAAVVPSLAQTEQGLTAFSPVVWCWLSGVVVTALISGGRLLLFRSKLSCAVPVGRNVYEIDHISSAFVLGMVRPKIYLPSGLTEMQRQMQLLHEQQHIRHGDLLVKRICYVAVCVHWFNPLVWVMYGLVCQDMELHCDESVVRQLGETFRAEYAEYLLSVSAGERIPVMSFGAGNLTARICNLRQMKSTGRFRHVLGMACCAVALLVCMANPTVDYMGNTVQLVCCPKCNRDVMTALTVRTQTVNITCERSDQRHYHNVIFAISGDCPACGYRYGRTDESTLIHTQCRLYE